MNQLSDLRRELGIVDPEKGKAGERREHKVKRPPAPGWKAEPTGGGALAEKLRLTGVVEERLRAEIEELRKPQCWLCWLKRWWSQE